MDTENGERPPNRPWLTVSVFLSVFAGFVLEVFAFAYLFTGLCDNVPENRTYCQVDNDSLYDDDNSNDDSEGVLYYRGYQFCVGIAVFIELFAVVKASCKITCCVEHACVPCCANTWECCVCCGHYWFVMSGLSVCINIIGIISVCMAVPFNDMITYIIGFRFGFSNILFGFIKLTVWSGYSIQRKTCCPDQAYFLGSNKRLTEFEIITTTKEWTETTHQDGTVTRTNKRITGRSRRKVQPACVH